MGKAKSDRVAVQEVGWTPMTLFKTTRNPSVFP